jgi:hypothetical protein
MFHKTILHLFFFAVTLLAQGKEYVAVIPPKSFWERQRTALILDAFGLISLATGAYLNHNRPHLESVCTADTIRKRSQEP